MTIRKTLSWMFLAGAFFLAAGCTEELLEIDVGGTTGSITGEGDPEKGVENEESTILKEEN